MSLPNEKQAELCVGKFYRYKQGGEERFKITLERKGDTTGRALAIYRKDGEIAVLTVATLSPENYEEVPKEDFDGKVQDVIADLQAVLDGKDKV